MKKKETVKPLTDKKQEGFHHKTLRLDRGRKTSPLISTKRISLITGKFDD